MADPIKQVSLVQIATIRRSDIEQIDHCIGLRVDDDGSVFQKEAGKDQCCLNIIGWFNVGAESVRILVQRVDDGRLLQAGLFYETSKLVTEDYPQLFLR